MAKNMNLKKERIEANKDKRPYATAKYLRISPYKIRTVLALIRGKSVDEAEAILTYCNKATSDVIAVYVYQQGIEQAKYSYSTAVGLFNTAINIVLLIIVNKIASKASDVQFV